VYALLGYTLICNWNVLHYNESHCNILTTETALDCVITHMEEPAENGEVTFGAFLNFDEAFCSTSFDVITKVAKRHGLGETTFRWICPMLGSRKIIAVLAEENLEGFVFKDSLQGGMLSVLLWSLVVDKLIRVLNKNRCSTLEYADDIAILISRKFSKNDLRVFKLLTPCILNQYFHLIYQLNALKMYMTV